MQEPDLNDTLGIWSADYDKSDPQAVAERIVAFLQFTDANRPEHVSSLRKVLSESVQIGAIEINADSKDYPCIIVQIVNGYTYGIKDTLSWIIDRCAKEFSNEALSCVGLSYIGSDKISFQIGRLGRSYSRVNA